MAKQVQAGRGHGAARHPPVTRIVGDRGRCTIERMTIEKTTIE
jgi:hypothetical protein